MGARLPGVVLVGVGLGRATCKGISLVQAPGQEARPLETAGRLVEGLGLWGKGWQRGRGGGAQRGKLWWPRHPAGAGGWGLGDASEVSQGPGTGRQTGAGGQDVGASLQRGLEPGRGKTSGEFWENVAARSEDVGLGVLDPVWGGRGSQWGNVQSSVDGADFNWRDTGAPHFEGVVELGGCWSHFGGEGEGHRRSLFGRRKTEKSVLRPSFPEECVCVGGWYRLPSAMGAQARGCHGDCLPGG